MNDPDQIIVHCPHCDAEYKAHDAGDREECNACGELFNRFTNTIGRGDGEACYKAVRSFIEETEAGTIEIDKIIIPSDYWHEVSELAEADENGRVAIRDVPVSHQKYQDGPEARVSINV